MGNSLTSIVFEPKFIFSHLESQSIAHTHNIHDSAPQKIRIIGHREVCFVSSSVLLYWLLTRSQSIAHTRNSAAPPLGRHEVCFQTQFALLFTYLLLADESIRKRRALSASSVSSNASIDVSSSGSLRSSSRSSRSSGAYSGCSAVTRNALPTKPSAQPTPTPSPAPSPAPSPETGLFIEFDNFLRFILAVTQSHQVHSQRTRALNQHPNRVPHQVPHQVQRQVCL